MAHYQSPHGTKPTQTDEYGNPVRQTDEYGNPVHQTGTMGEYGTTGIGTTGGHGYAGGGVGTGLHEGKEHHGLGGVLHRSGSSSSSSSEDDGHGGRRKKGLKEKIKEKLPGTGHKEQTQSHETATTTQGLHGYGTAGEHHEKKGVMEKIKENLPGGGGGGHH